MRQTVRLWRWRRNPLRRRSDVVQAWAGVTAGVVMAVGAPITGIAAADGMHAALTAQNQERHQVTATVARNARPVPAPHNSDSGPDEVQAPVTWRGHDGRVHSAHVVVGPGKRAGSTTTVWVDHHERITDPPLDGLQTAVQTDIIGAAAAGGFCVAALVGHRLVRLDLDRRRARQWQREWGEVGPQWSRGHRR